MNRVDCGDCPNVTSGCEAGHCLRRTDHLNAPSHPAGERCPACKPERTLLERLDIFIEAIPMVTDSGVPLESAALLKLLQDCKSALGAVKL